MREGSLETMGNLKVGEEKNINQDIYVCIINVNIYLICINLLKTGKLFNANVP